MLAEERGPLPLAQLLKLARVSRAVIERLERRAKCRSGKSRVTAVGPLEADLSPPANILNADQQRAVGEIQRGWMLAYLQLACFSGSPGAAKPKCTFRRSKRRWRVAVPRWCWFRKSR